MRSMILPSSQITWQEMFNVVRTVRARFGDPNLLIARKTCGIRFTQEAAAAGQNQPHEPGKMDIQKQEAKSKSGDMMGNSFGEGYATRSDEEGFGGVYGGNQNLGDDYEDKIIHGTAPPEYDYKQGSEVKEKERARNQSKVAS